jgi:[acyl-carrier-protein] S-malonyltransferase
MVKLAFIFPGQGSQSVGMGKDLYENFEVAKAVFDEADKVLGKNISTICFEGPDEDLKQTINTQPAILTTSIAALEALKSKIKIKPAFVAGHSLGEYCALYESDVLTLENTLKLIAKRAELMSLTKGGSMAAVLGLDENILLECLNKASTDGYVSVANYNCPGQIVITGTEEGIKKASELLTAAGAKRVMPLAVSGAFHSELMKDASEEFAKYLQEFVLSDASISVITNVDAKITIKAEDFKSKMPQQIYSSVYWTQTIQKMIEEGVDTFIEIGPGKVLAGLNKKINSEITTYNVFDKASLNACVEAINLQLV